MVHSTVPDKKIGRPSAPLDRAAMLEAAKLFFGNGLTRDAIAQRMGIQGRKVTQLLEQSRQRNIVRIQFAENDASEEELERGLKEKYPHLKRAIVVASDGRYEDLPRRWAVAAADYFEDLYKTRPGGNEWHVAVTGDEALWALATAISDEKREHLYVHVSALIGHGRFAKKTKHLDAQTVADMIWARSGRIPGHVEVATVSPYHIPKSASLAKRREIVAEEINKVQANPIIREVIDGMDGLDALFGGIGSVTKHDSQPVKSRGTMESLLHTVITPQELGHEKAIGHFAYCPYGITGHRKDKWRFFLTAGHYFKRYWGIEFFKQRMVERGKVVAGFGAMPQLPAVRVALEAKIINALITETHCARELAGNS